MAKPSSANPNQKRSNDKEDEFDQRDFFLIGKMGPSTTNSASSGDNIPPLANTASPESKLLLKFNWSDPYVCPIHNARLMRADDKIYNMLDEDKHTLFKCCLDDQPATKLNKKLGPCRTDVLFVCSGDEKCLYCFCNSCLQPTMLQEKAIDYYTSYINLKRNPSAVISLVSFLCLQSIYLPISQSALMILACHHSQLCEHPLCYDDITPSFFNALIVAFVSLILVTIGLPLYWYLSIRSRKKKVYSVFDSPTQWEELLEQDETSLANLYNKYEQEFMTFEPFLMVSRSLSLSAAVALTEPESLAQMLTVAAINVLNTLLIIKTAPFIDCYIDIISKLDLWHSCFLVGFLCFDQASRIFLPGEDVLGIPMLVVSGVFFLAYGSVFYKTVIRSFLDHRSLSKANELEREEQMWLNDDKVERRLKNLKGVLAKKKDFFGKDHLQPVLTMSHIYQSISSRSEKEATLRELCETFLTSIEMDYDLMKKGKSTSSSSGVLAQFSFRTGSWKSWSSGLGLQSLGEALRDAPERIKDKIVLALHKWTMAKGHGEKAAKSNAFSLLVTTRVPIENLDLSGMNLTSVFGCGAIVRNCKLQNANLMSVDFTGSTFTNCDFQGAHLDGALFGPQHKKEIVSVWTSVVTSKLMNRYFKDNFSINFDESLLAVSGFADFFVVLQASSGHRLFTSEKLSTDGIDREDLRDMKRSNFEDTKAIFSPADPTLFYMMKHKVWSFSPPYRKPNKFLALKEDINTVEFSRNGEFFFCRSDESNDIFIGLTKEMVILAVHSPETSNADWPLTCHFSDFIIIDAGDQFGEGTDMGIELEVRNFKQSLLDLKYKKNNNNNNNNDPSSLTLLSQKKSKGKDYVSDMKSDLVYKLTSSEYFLYISHDGKFFAQYNSESKKCLIRSFTDLVDANAAKYAAAAAEKEKNAKNSIKNKFLGKLGAGDQQKQQQTATSSAPTTTKQEENSGTNGNNKPKPNTNVICSFKYPSALHDPFFFQMADGFSIVVTGIMEGTTTGIAQLFSTISGRKIGELYYSLKPPTQRWKQREIVHQPGIKIMHCRLDQSGTFLYILSRVISKNVGDFQDENDTRDLEELYLCKVLLSFGTVSEKAVVKTVANEVAKVVFMPDSTLLALYEDFHVRKLDVQSDIREYYGSAMSVSFAFSDATVHPRIYKYIALMEPTFVALADLEAKQELFVFPTKEEEGLIWKMDQHPCPNDERLAMTEKEKDEILEKKRAKEEAERLKEEAREAKRRQRRRGGMNNSSRKKRFSDSDEEGSGGGTDDSDEDDAYSDDDDDDESDYNSDSEDSDKTGSANSDDDEDYEVEMNCPCCIEFSPDGQYLAVGVDADHQDIFLWKINNLNPNNNNNSKPPTKELVRIFTRPKKANLNISVNYYHAIKNIIFFRDPTSGRELILGFEEEKSRIIIFDLETGICFIEVKTIDNLAALYRFNEEFFIAFEKKGAEIYFFSVEEVIAGLEIPKKFPTPNTPEFFKIAKDAKFKDFPSRAKFSFETTLPGASVGKEVEAISFTRLVAGNTNNNKSSSVLAVGGERGFMVLDLIWSSASSSNKMILENVIPRVVVCETLLQPTCINRIGSGCTDTKSLTLSPDGNKLVLEKSGMKVWDVGPRKNFESFLTSQQKDVLFNNKDFKNRKVMEEKLKIVREYELFAPKPEEQRMKLMNLEAGGGNAKQQPFQIVTSSSNSATTTTTTSQNSNNKSKTNIFGTESGAWIFSRSGGGGGVSNMNLASNEDDSARELVQSLLLGQILAEEKEKQSKSLSPDQQQQLLLSSQLSKKNPASGCLRRLETSSFLSRYLNDCVVDDVDNFASDPPPDALDHDAVCAFAAEYEKDDGIERSDNIKAKLAGRPPPKQKSLVNSSSSIVSSPKSLAAPTTANPAVASSTSLQPPSSSSAPSKTPAVPPKISSSSTKKKASSDDDDDDDWSDDDDDDDLSDNDDDDDSDDDDTALKFKNRWDDSDDDLSLGIDKIDPKDLVRGGGDNDSVDSDFAEMEITNKKKSVAAAKAPPPKSSVVPSPPATKTPSQPAKTVPQSPPVATKKKPFVDSDFEDDEFL